MQSLVLVVNGVIDIEPHYSGTWIGATSRLLGLARMSRYTSYPETVADKISISTPVRSSIAPLPYQEDEAVFPWQSTTFGERPGQQDAPLSLSSAFLDSSPALHSRPESESECFVQSARASGLTNLYLSDNPFAQVSLPSPPDSSEADLDGSEQPTLLLAEGSVNVDSYERLNITKESAQVLHSLLSASLSYIQQRSWCGIDNSTPRICDLKMTEALLSSDNDRDTKELEQRNAIDLTPRGMSSFDLDKSADESLQWPDWTLRLGQDLCLSLKSERLDVKVATMQYLKQLLAIESLHNSDLTRLETKTNHVCLCERTLSAQMTDRPEASRSMTMTPPLIPFSRPTSPFVPSHFITELELASTPDDLLAHESHEASQYLADDDVLESTAALSDFTSATCNGNVCEQHVQVGQHQSLSQRPARNLKRSKDMRLDVPLTPQVQFEPSPKRPRLTVLSNEIEVLLPDNLHNQAKQQTTASNSDDDLSGFLAILAETANQVTDDEHLCPVDTALRVPVPGLEHTTDQNLNHTDSIDAHPTFRGSPFPPKLIGPDNECPFSGDLKQIERSLMWTPFASQLALLNLNESLPDSDAIEDLQYKTVIDQAAYERQSLFRKPQSLRLLDGEECENEVLLYASIQDSEPHPQSNPGGKSSDPKHNYKDQSTERNVSQVSNKSKAMTVMSVPQVADAGSGRLPMAALLQMRKLQLETLRNTDVQRPNTDSKQQLPPSNDPPQVQKSSGLFEFLQVHQGISSVRDASAENVGRDAHRTDDLCSLDPHALHLPATLMQIPARKIPSLESPLSIIVSSTMMGNRLLIRRLREQMPKCEFLERAPIDDLSIMEKGSVTQHFCPDAHFIISPGTGIVITSLQKMRQRPLPGQSRFSGGLQWLAEVAVHYEHLIVLISEVQPVDRHTLNEDDCETMADIVAFATTIATDIESYYVPGDDNALSQVVSELIARHCHSHQDSKLLHEETVWENSLRRAGFNAYAAQVVLFSLKEQTRVSAVEPWPRNTAGADEVIGSGLAAFMRMTARDRAQILAPILRGERMLGRTNQNLDWLSSAPVLIKQNEAGAGNRAS